MHSHIAHTIFRLQHAAAGECTLAKVTLFQGANPPERTVRCLQLPGLA